METKDKEYNLIKLIDEYYNNAEKEHGKKLPIDMEYTVEFREEDNLNTATIINNKKKIMKVAYNIIGAYDIKISVWYWAWAIGFAARSQTKESEKVKKFVKQLKKENPLNSNIENYYFYGKTNFFMKPLSEIINLIKLMLYITKNIWFFRIKRNKDNGDIYYQYFSISKIIEEY